MMWHKPNGEGNGVCPQKNKYRNYFKIALFQQML